MQGSWGISKFVVYFLDQDLKCDVISICEENKVEIENKCVCKADYFENNNKCEKCHEFCLTCDGMKENNCKSCDKIAYLKSNECHKCPIFCIACLNENKCTECVE